MSTAAIDRGTQQLATPWITLAKLGRAAVVGAVAIASITGISSVAILASPALPPILAILTIAIPPVVFITGQFLAVMFVAFPVLIATSVYSAAFMIPFGIAVGAAVGTAALLFGVGALMVKIGDKKAKSLGGQGQLEHAIRGSCLGNKGYLENLAKRLNP